MPTRAPSPAPPPPRDGRQGHSHLQDPHEALEALGMLQACLATGAPAPEAVALALADSLATPARAKAIREALPTLGLTPKEAFQGMAAVMRTLGFDRAEDHGSELWEFQREPPGWDLDGEAWRVEVMNVYPLDLRGWVWSPEAWHIDGGGFRCYYDAGPNGDFDAGLAWLEGNRAVAPRPSHPKDVQGPAASAGR